MKNLQKTRFIAFPPFAYMFFAKKGINPKIIPETITAKNPLCLVTKMPHLHPDQGDRGDGSCGHLKVTTRTVPSIAFILLKQYFCLYLSTSLFALLINPFLLIFLNIYYVRFYLILEFRYNGLHDMFF